MLMTIEENIRINFTGWSVLTNTVKLWRTYYKLCEYKVFKTYHGHHMLKARGMTPFECKHIKSCHLYTLSIGGSRVI